MFMDGGPSMYLVLTALLMAVPMALIVLVVAVGARWVRDMLWPARVLAVLALLVALTPGCAGGAGYLHGMSQMNAALEHASPEVREQMRARGTELARIPLVSGALSAAVALLPAGLALLIAWAPRRRWEELPADT